MKPLACIKNSAPSDLIDQCDIDLTPMMSMFIMLIPFLVSMAVLTHLTIIPFSLPPNVGTGMDMSQGTPRPKLTVILARDFLAITRGESLLDSLPVAAQGYDFTTLSDRLTAYRAEQADGELVVAVRDDIPVKSLVAVMDRCRESGFDDLGLSSATIDPTFGK